jgi:simple sugar transport system permease protein
VKKSILFHIRNFFVGHPEGGAFVAFLIVFLFFSIFTKHFIEIPSLISILSVGSLFGIVSVAITLLMIGGEFDLSVGSVWGLSAILVPSLTNHNFPAWAAILLMLVIGIAIGLMQGLIVVKVGIPSFIVTLAGMMLWRSLVYFITEGSYISWTIDLPFLKIFNYKFDNGFSVSTLWFIGIAIILGLILQRTRFGNWIYATGGNKISARQAGVPVDRVKLILFVISAVFASLGGIIQTTQYRMATADYGVGVEMTVIAMAVIGGNRLTGGYGSVVGTVIGIITLSMIQNGMVLGGIPSDWFRAFVGVIILLTVIINTTIQRRAIGMSRD